MRTRSWWPLAALILVLAIMPASAHAIRVGDLDTVLNNPANSPALVSTPIDDEEYDEATHCSPKARPGMTRFVAWLGANHAGEFWGTYRCEKWGPKSASLHAENRAVDWHLDSRVPSSRAAGKRLIEQLLATDKAGNRHALARRMGVEEIIWDCSYWSSGMDEFKRYSACYNKHGVKRKRVNPTVAHQDHLHISLSKKGAAAKTSFWTR